MEGPDPKIPVEAIVEEWRRQRAPGAATKLPCGRQQDSLRSEQVAQQADVRRRVFHAVQRRARGGGGRGAHVVQCVRAQ